MKNTARKYKFNIPQLGVVENMANQTLRKKIFEKFFFENLAFTRPRVLNSTSHFMKYPNNDWQTCFWQNEG